MLCLLQLYATFRRKLRNYIRLTIITEFLRAGIFLSNDIWYILCKGYLKKLPVIHKDDPAKTPRKGGYTPVTKPDYRWREWDTNPAT